MTAEIPTTLKFAVGAAKEFSWPTPRTKALNDLADRLGRELGLELRSGTLQEVAEQVSQIWKGNGLGEIVAREAGRVIEFRKCPDCESSKNGLTSLPCEFKGRLVSGALSYAVGKRVRLSEVSCCRKGAAACTFWVRGQRQTHKS